MGGFGSGGHNKNAVPLEVILGKGSKSKASGKRTRKARVKVPKAPDYLPPEAQEFWSRMAPQLVPKGFLTDTDLPAFETLALTYWVIKGAQKEITEQGFNVKGPRGTKVRNPAVSTLNQATATFRALSMQFRMTPVTRSGADTKDEEPDELERLFAGV